MGYTKYDFQVVKLDKRAYYPRADKPMETLVKPEWDKAMLVSRMWYKESMRKAYFPDDSVAKQVRPTIIMQGGGYAKGMMGARFATAQEYEEVPYGDNESDLKALKLEAERQYKNATLENTANRVRTMLSMLGDVQVIKKDDATMADTRPMRWNSNYQIMKVKDCTLVLFEPEMEDA